jgi:hypothetical protein
MVWNMSWWGNSALGNFWLQVPDAPVHVPVTVPARFPGGPGPLPHPPATAPPPWLLLGRPELAAPPDAPPPRRVPHPPDAPPPRRVAVEAQIASMRRSIAALEALGTAPDSPAPPQTDVAEPISTDIDNSSDIDTDTTDDPAIEDCGMRHLPPWQQHKNTRSSTSSRAVKKTQKAKKDTKTKKAKQDKKAKK